MHQWLFVHFNPVNKNAVFLALYTPKIESKWNSQYVLWVQNLFERWQIQLGPTQCFTLRSMRKRESHWQCTLPHSSGIQASTSKASSWSCIIIRIIVHFWSILIYCRPHPSPFSLVCKGCFLVIFFCSCLFCWRKFQLLAWSAPIFRLQLSLTVILWNLTKQAYWRSLWQGEISLIIHQLCYIFSFKFNCSCNCKCHSHEMC